MQVRWIMKVTNLKNWESQGLPKIRDDAWFATKNRLANIFVKIGSFLRDWQNNFLVNFLVLPKHWQAKLWNYTKQPKSFLCQIKLLTIFDLNRIEEPNSLLCATFRTMVFHKNLTTWIHVSHTKIKLITRKPKTYPYSVICIPQQGA